MSDLVSTKDTIHNVSISGNIAGLDPRRRQHQQPESAQCGGGIYAGTAALGQSFSFFPNLHRWDERRERHDHLAFGDRPRRRSRRPARPAPSSRRSSPMASPWRRRAMAASARRAATSTLSRSTARPPASPSRRATAARPMSASHHPNGGAGGGIANIYVKGFTDVTPNDVISIHAGKGGAADSVGTGGTGGSVASLYIGTSLVGRASHRELGFRAGRRPGDGGRGRHRQIRRHGRLARDDLGHHEHSRGSESRRRIGLTHEITLQAGDGGNSTDTTTTRLGILHSGLGGSIRSVAVTDQHPEALPYDPTQSATVFAQGGRRRHGRGPRSRDRRRWRRAAVR